MVLYWYPMLLVKLLQHYWGSGTCSLSTFTGVIKCKPFVTTHSFVKYHKLNVKWIFYPSIYDTCVTSHFCTYALIVKIWLNWTFHWAWTLINRVCLYRLGGICKVQPVVYIFYEPHSPLSIPVVNQICVCISNGVVYITKPLFSSRFAYMCIPVRIPVCMKWILLAIFGMSQSSYAKTDPFLGLIR